MELDTDQSLLLQPFTRSLLSTLLSIMERGKLKLSPTHLDKLLLVKQLVESSQAWEATLLFHSDPSLLTSHMSTINYFCCWNLMKGTQIWIWHFALNLFQIIKTDQYFLLVV